MEILYLGPEGAFSHDAALELVARSGLDAAVSPQVNVEAVVRTVAKAKDDAIIGLIPYYNFLEGLVQEHLDLIYEFRLQIFGVIRLPIRLAAGAFEASPAATSEIFSHPKALAQVSEFIQATFRDATIVPVNSTAEAARMVAAQKHGVAIASERALDKYAVPILARDVGNRRQGKANFTDFFMVGHGGGASRIDLGAPNRSIVAIVPQIDRLGLLADILGQFRFYELDIAKIHSRPAIDTINGAGEPQMFYLEVACAPDAAPLMRCADAIRYSFSHDKSSGDPVRVMGGFRI